MTPAPVHPRPREHGFWDYTTPGAGGMECYEHDDYVHLLDDMAAAGMNSLLIVVKWFTTGYRSRLPFLDQSPDNTVIASDNDLLRLAIREAHSRGIMVRLGAVASAYETRLFSTPAWASYTGLSGYAFSRPVGYYDADTPGLHERAIELCTEIAGLFPDADGLMVELEFAGVEMPHRAEPYNRWAASRGAPEFSRLGRPLNPRCFDEPHWRQYATERRTDFLRAIEASVRNSGFRGSLFTICETGHSPGSMAHELDLELLRRACPAWRAVTYEYDKWDHRYGMMDLCIETPMRVGLPTWYLARGVMTWGCAWPLPIPLAQSWAMDVEDVLAFRPDGFWWFGSGSRGEGAHVSDRRLASLGFCDGRAARRALLAKAAALGAMPPGLA